MRIKIVIDEYGCIEIIGKGVNPVCHDDFLGRNGLQRCAKYIVSIMRTKPKSKGYKRYEFIRSTDGFMRSMSHGYLSMCQREAIQILKLPKNTGKKNFILWAKFTEIKNK